MITGKPFFVKIGFPINYLDESNPFPININILRIKLVQKRKKLLLSVAFFRKMWYTYYEVIINVKGC
jgi:hypothetical protein